MSLAVSKNDLRAELARYIKVQKGIENIEVHVPDDLVFEMEKNSTDVIIFYSREHTDTYKLPLIHTT